MKYFDRLSQEEKVEVMASVHDAYVKDDGSLRWHPDADKIFDQSVTKAKRQGKRWADVLLDGWREDGRKAFLMNRFKNGKLFDLPHKGRIRKRTLRRGTRVRDDDGREKWIQEELLYFDSPQLRAAIKQSNDRIEEDRANIAMCRALLDLLKETRKRLVHEGLKVKGMSLEEYLASRDAA